MNVGSNICEWFFKHQRTLALAESCTGGLISAAVTEFPGVSSFFLGGVVSYHGDVKADVLGVKQSSMATLGQVSDVVALQMAHGVRHKLKSDWSVSVTGIAGPGGGSPEKPVGTVFVAVVGPVFERVEQRVFDGTSRQKIRQQTVNYALELLWECINSNH